MHTYTQTHKYTYACTHTKITHIRTHTYPAIFIHTYTNANIYQQTYTPYSYIYIKTYTYLHIYIYSPIIYLQL